MVELKKTEKILVSKDALVKLLAALNGPEHLVREMLMTRSVSQMMGAENPINTLVDDLCYSMDIEGVLESNDEEHF